MGDPTTCPHNGLYWYAAPANEEGWKCIDCGWQPGEPPGFSPAHDRSHIETKVGCIVHDLHEANIIYVSNGDCGDGLTAVVARRCVASSLYDSVSIARLVLEVEADERHAKFWRDISDGILAGKDPRKRCHCGKLADVWRSGPDGGTHACSFDHLPADPPAPSRQPRAQRSKANR